MDPRYADRTVFLVVGMGPTEPAAKKARKLVAGHRFVIRMHVPDGRESLVFFHEIEEIVDQLEYARLAAGSLE